MGDPMLVADTSFLVPLFRKEDVHSVKAGETIVALREEIDVPDTVLYETLSVLNHKCGFAVAKEAYGKLCENLQMNLIHLDSAERDGAIMEFMLHGGKLSPVDCSVLYFSRKMGAKILSFDDDLNKASTKK